MLWPEDQLLIERDRALPGLRLLFDADAFVDALRRGLSDARIDCARLAYLRYKPATSCIASFQLDTSSGPVDVYAVAYPKQECAKLHKGIAAAHPGALGPGALVWEDVAVAVHFFPNDIRLGGLRELALSRHDLLQKLLPRKPQLWDAAITRLAYKPHRRHVAMLSLSAPRAVMKCYTRSGYESAARSARAIRSRGVLRVPPRIGRSTRHAIAVYRWIDGSPLGNVAQMSPHALARLGAAVREIHCQDAPQLPLIDREVDAARLTAVAGAVGDILPNLAERARKVARRLIETYPQPQSITTIHGDLHAKQVLISDRKVAILDLDEAARSSPIADLGNFVGHLHRHAILIEADSAAIGRGTSAFLEGYDDVPTSAFEQELAWHTAASLLRLTPHPFRVRDPGWAGVTETMLRRVEQMVEDNFGGAQSSSVQRASIDDPFNVRIDPKLGALALAALDPETVSRYAGSQGIRAMRVLRHKPSRRCVIEYSLADGVVLIGKVRAKGADRSTFRIVQALRRNGFHDGSPDGIAVPEPIALVPQAGMWVQRKVAGAPASELLSSSDGPRLAARIAEALVRLHRASIPVKRTHTMDDELGILHKRLNEVAVEHPHHASQVREILTACTELAADMPAGATCGIHRDFYADHVLLAGRRLWLIDFDLYCEGDPALDAGNFVAHVKEQALRGWNDPHRLDAVARAFEHRFIELTNESLRPRIRVYELLTLARHVSISTRIPPRRHLTGSILEMCENLTSRFSSPI